MRFVGVALMILGAGTIYELYYKGRTLQEALGDVVRVFQLPASPGVSWTAGGSPVTLPAVNAYPPQPPAGSRGSHPS